MNETKTKQKKEKENTERLGKTNTENSDCLPTKPHSICFQSSLSVNFASTGHIFVEFIHNQQFP